MTDSKRKPMHKLPAVVRREYLRAIAPFEHLTPEEIEHQLAAHQRAKIAAVQQGVTMALSKADHATEPNYHDLERLANARRAIGKASTPEGAADLISEPVIKAVRSLTAKEQENRRKAVERTRIAEEIDKLAVIKGRAAVEKVSAAKLQIWLEFEGITASLATIKRAKTYWLK